MTESITKRERVKGLQGASNLGCKVKLKISELQVNDGCGEAEKDSVVAPREAAAAAPKRDQLFSERE